MISGANTRATFIGWAVSFLIFGAAFAFASWRPGIGALIIETAAVMSMVLLLCNGFEGTLLVLVAMQLPELVSRRGAIGWIIVQNILLFTSIAIHWSPSPAFLLTPPYLGFQLLAYLAFEALAREAAARRDLERAHASCRRCTAYPSTAAGSRRDCASPRSSRLPRPSPTALSLNLEAALRKSKVTRAKRSSSRRR